MKKNESTLRACPYDSLTESLCLDVNLSDDDKKKAQIHLQQCPTCRTNYQEIEGVYELLGEEVRKPVTNKVLDLAKEIRSKDTRYGLVVCEPLDGDKTKKAHSYKTRVLFTANGTGSNNKSW